MGFGFAHGCPVTHIAWFPIDATTGVKLYVGQLVKNSTGSSNGVMPVAAASGVSDLGGDQQLLGIVMGTNNYPLTELFDATYGQYIATTTTMTQALQKAIMKMGVEGNTPKGDPQPLVQVGIIDNTTWLRGEFYNATYGVAPTLLTVTTGDTTGAGCTTNACDVATVANLCTFCFRTGANAGIYRVVKSASDTTHTFDTYFPYAIAVGDTGVIVPARLGSSYVQTTSTANYYAMGFNSAATAATNYFGVDVKGMYLMEAGRESITFRFNAAHFAGIRT